LNKVRQDIEAGVALVSTIQGALSYLKGLVWNRFEFWLQRMADLNMTDVEKVRLIAQDYLGVNLTPGQCASVQSILGLQAVVTSYHDASTLLDFEKAINKDPVGMATTIQVLKTSARHNIAEEILFAYKNMATKEFDDVDGHPRTLEDKVIGLMTFGFSKSDAEKCQWSGNVVMDRSGRLIEFYGLAGLDVNTKELV
jgi:hypothetical protein